MSLRAYGLIDRIRAAIYELKHMSVKRKRELIVQAIELAFGFLFVVGVILLAAVFIKLCGVM